MALGHKSNVTTIKVFIGNEARNGTVLVQSNKNYGICDIFFIDKFFRPCRMTEVLSVFQGRQANDSGVLEHLSRVLNRTFNPERN